MEILIPLSFFAMIAAIVLVPGYLRSRNREKMLETLRVAYEKGQPVPAELIDAINTDPKQMPAALVAPADSLAISSVTRSDATYWSMWPIP